MFIYQALQRPLDLIPQGVGPLQAERPARYPGARVAIGLWRCHFARDPSLRSGRLSPSRATREISPFGRDDVAACHPEPVRFVQKLPAEALSGATQVDRDLKWLPRRSLRLTAVSEVMSIHRRSSDRVFAQTARVG